MNFLASLSMRAISRFSKLRSKALANKSKLKFSISFISLNLLTFPPKIATPHLSVTKLES